MSNGNVALKAAGKIDAADTTLVARFKAAGLVIAGRTNTPEMGSLPTTQPLAWGATRNPWALERTPGGSSGGAAAAVAAGMVPFANASDGGGSIRIPASCCGLVGLKPSQGRITVGPARAEVGLGVELCVSHTVRDTAGLLDAVRGPGVGDTVIAPAPDRPYVDEVGADPGLLRIGLLDVHPRGDFVHEDCVSAVRAAASMLEGLGHTVEPAWPACLADTSLPEKFMALWATQMAMAAREFSETLGREVTADDIEPVNWALVERAQRLTAVDYAAAQAAGWAFRRALQQWWADGWDLLLTPTLAEPPVPLTEFENNPEHPTAPMRRAGRFAAYHPGVQHQRATGDQPAPASQHRRPPHRHPTRCRLRPGGHPHTRRRPTGIGPPVVVRPPGNPLTVVASVSCGGRLRVIGSGSDGWRCVVA